jgi:excisionase family DNA binding protein
MTFPLFIGLCCVYLAIGLIIVYEDQYPLRGKRIVTGRHARMIGTTFAFPGIVGLVALLFSNQVNLAFSIANLVFIIALLNAYFTVGRHAVEIDKPKRKRQPLPDVLTVSEAARYLKVEGIDIRHLIEDGELQAKAVGGDYRISSAALQAYLDS